MAMLRSCMQRGAVQPVACVQVPVGCIEDYLHSSCVPLRRISPSNHQIWWAKTRAGEGCAASHFYFVVGWREQCLAGSNVQCMPLPPVTLFEVRPQLCKRL
jgi:hypothetical protein